MLCYVVYGKGRVLARDTGKVKGQAAGNHKPEAEY